MFSIGIGTNVMDSMVLRASHVFFNSIDQKVTQLSRVDLWLKVTNIEKCGCVGKLMKWRKLPLLQQQRFPCRTSIKLVSYFLDAYTKSLYSGLERKSQTYTSFIC